MQFKLSSSSLSFLLNHSHFSEQNQPVKTYSAVNWNGVCLTILSDLNPIDMTSSTTTTRPARDDPDAGDDGDPESSQLSYLDPKIPFGDIHRLVLQGIMSAGILDAKGVKKLFVTACNYLNFRGKDLELRTNFEFIQQVVRDINDKIKPFDMNIRSASCELTRKKFYIFLVTVEKPLLKFQTVFSKFEVSLFRKIMDTMLRKYETYTIPPAECLNLASKCEPSGTLSLAEAFVTKMVQQQYFIEFPMTKDSFEYTLGVRALRELETILNDNYFDVITKCSLCKMTLLHGILCYQCKLVMHKSCHKRYIKSSSICPQCKVTWLKSKMIWRTRNEESMEYDLELDPGTGGTGTGTSRAVDSANDSLIPPVRASSATSSPATTEDPDMPILSPMEIDAALGNLGRNGRQKQERK